LNLCTHRHRYSLANDRQLGWIISATCPPVDDREPLWIDEFLDHLDKRAEDRGSQSQLGSIEELMSEIVTYSIASYEGPFFQTRQDQNIPGINQRKDLSIRQAFSTYIKSIVRLLEADVATIATDLS
jgi:hypothetical protein